MKAEEVVSTFVQTGIQGTVGLLCGSSSHLWGGAAPLSAEGHFPCSSPSAGAGGGGLEAEEAWMRSSSGESQLPLLVGKGFQALKRWFSACLGVMDTPGG